MARRVLLHAGDHVHLQVEQNSGGDLQILKEGEASPEFAMTWLAPGPAGG